MPHQNLGSNSLACATHVIGDAAFVDDTLFMPDGHSARQSAIARSRRQRRRRVLHTRISTLLLREQCFPCADTITGSFKATARD